MDKKTITQIATAALITTAGITVTNNIKPLNNITGSGEVKAATTQSAQQFINKAASAATNASSKYGTYTSVMIAQAAVESGYGNSTLSQEPNNNLFGIKGSYNGQSVAMKTGEYDSNGNYYTTTANFRKYPSYEESFNDNGALLRSQMGDYYSGAWVENADSGKEATQNGLQGKYATAPSYSQTLNSVIDTYNLDQYDPVTTNVNETKTVTNTTPIVDAPVDIDVGTQVGTAREGQQVNVTKYITYNNGVSHAYIGTGWVNNSAFATTQSTTTDTSASQTTQPTQATQSTQPAATSQTNTVQQPASQPAKPATTQVQATKAVQTNAVKKTTATQTVKTPVEKASTTVKKTTVSQAPVTKTVEAVAKTTASKSTTPAKPVAKTTPKTATVTNIVQKVAQVTPTSAKAASTTKKVATSQVKATPQVEKTATTTPVTATQTKVVEKTTSSKKATIQKADTVKSVVKEAEVVTPVVDEKKNDTEATVVTTQAAKKEDNKQTSKASAKTVAPKAAATVAVTKTTKKSAEPVKSVKTAVKLASTSVSQKIVSVAKSVKPVTVKAATKQVSAPKKTVSKAKTATIDVSTSKANSKVEKLATKPIVETTTTKKVSAEASQIGSDYVIKARGVLTINARPNYGVAIWSVPGKKRTSRYLQNGTSWKFFKIAMINGEKWYNLGGNQWVPAKAVMVR